MNQGDVISIKFQIGMNPVDADDNTDDNTFNAVGSIGVAVDDDNTVAFANGCYTTIDQKEMYEVKGHDPFVAKDYILNDDAQIPQDAANGVFDHIWDEYN